MTTRHLTIEGRLEEIDAIIDFIGDAARHAGFDQRTTYACQLATSEAIENIIIHGYGVRNQEEIEIRTRISPEHLEIVVKDSAPPFNSAVIPKEKKINTTDPKPGGLGLMIIHRVMDEVEYDRRGGLNILRMVKRTSQVS
jgi:serine/threonine-protein kinase RsbW